MISRIILATAVSFTLGTAAIAQQQPTTAAAGQSTNGGSNQQGMPMGWDGPVSEAFYSNGTLRSETDVRTGFSGLSAEQQAMVKKDCAAFATAPADSAGGAISNETTSATGAANQTATGTSQGGGTSGASSSGANQVASMDQLCGYVGSM